MGSSAPGQDCGSCGIASMEDYRVASGLLRRLYSNVNKIYNRPPKISCGAFLPTRVHVA